MPDLRYVDVTIAIFEEDYEILYSILVDYEFIGMEERLDEIKISFEEKDWNDAIQKKLEEDFTSKLPKAKITKIEIIIGDDWNKEWEKNVEPVRVSEQIVITPEWKMKDFDCEILIIINPKMSFGTGQHSTTLLMAQAIEKLFKTDKHKATGYWIDAGTGTGILAIEAAMLGATKVIAFDNDEWAYENALENIKRNGTSVQIDVMRCGIDEFIFPDVHCITANMYIGLITASLHKFHSALKKENGVLFVSGILQFDRDEAVTAAEQAGFILTEETTDQEWCCFTFKLNNQ